MPGSDRILVLSDSVYRCLALRLPAQSSITNTLAASSISILSGSESSPVLTLDTWEPSDTVLRFCGADVPVPLPDALLPEPVPPTEVPLALAFVAPAVVALPLLTVVPPTFTVLPPE